MKSKLEKALKEAEHQLKVWNVPSAVIAVVKGDEVLYAGGIGYRDNDSLPADDHTLVQIASCTKAFTATALAVLATEGKFDFDKPLTEYLPDFRLNDSYATEHLTMRDYLSHRSGLPRHEYAWYDTGFTRKELLHNLRYLPLNAPIRYRYQYSNFNYMIAGAVIEAISGMQFEDFLKEKVLLPLGMKESTVYDFDFHKRENIGVPYDYKEIYTMGEIKQISYYGSDAISEDARSGDPTAAAGCIGSNSRDMAKWLSYNLRRGKKEDGSELISEEMYDLMTSSHSFLAETGGANAPEHGMETYGLGWRIFRYRGKKVIEHGGNLPGFSSTVMISPEDDIGVFVSSTLNVTLFSDATAHYILDSLTGAPDGNWYERMKKQNEDMFTRVKEFFAPKGEPVPNTSPSHDLPSYAGTYRVPGYREAVISEENGKLYLAFNNHTLPLSHWHYDVFVTDTELDEIPPGLQVRFESDNDGNVTKLIMLLGSEKDLEPITFTKEVQQ